MQVQCIYNSICKYTIFRIFWYIIILFFKSKILRNNAIIACPDWLLTGPVFHDTDCSSGPLASALQFWAILLPIIIKLKLRTLDKNFQNKCLLLCSVSWLAFECRPFIARMIHKSNGKSYFNVCTLSTCKCIL